MVECIPIASVPLGDLPGPPDDDPVTAPLPFVFKLSSAADREMQEISPEEPFNAVFSVTANRTGEDRRPHGTLRFTGRSQIVGPKGEILFRAPAARTEVHVMRIDPSRARNKSITARNHLLRDRRPELYSLG